MESARSNASSVAGSAGGAAVTPASGLSLQSRQRLAAMTAKGVLQIKRSAEAKGMRESMVAGEIEAFVREFLEVMPSAAHAAAAAGGADEDAVLRVAERFMDASTDDRHGDAGPAAAALSRASAAPQATTAAVGGIQSPAASADARWLAIRNIVATATDATALLPTRARATAKLLELQVPLEVDIDSFCSAMRSLGDDAIAGSAVSTTVAAAVRISTAEQLLSSLDDCRRTALAALAAAVATFAPTTTATDAGQRAAALLRVLAHLIDAGMHVHARGPGAMQSVGRTGGLVAPGVAATAVTVEGVDAVAFPGIKGAPLLQWCAAACAADGYRGIGRFARSVGIPVMNAVAAMAIAGCEFTTTVAGDTHSPTHTASGATIAGAAAPSSVGPAESQGVRADAEQPPRPAMRLVPSGSALTGLDAPAEDATETARIERAAAAAFDQALDASVLPLLPLPAADHAPLPSPVNARPPHREAYGADVRAPAAASAKVGPAAVPGDSMSFAYDSDEPSDAAPARPVPGKQATQPIAPSARPANPSNTPAPRMQRPGIKAVRFHGASPATSASGTAMEAVAGRKRSHAEMAGGRAGTTGGVGAVGRAGGSLYGHSVWDGDAHLAPQAAAAIREDAMWGEVLHGPGRVSSKPRPAATYSRSSMGVWKAAPHE